MEVLEAIKTRRSIRQYKDIPVSDETLELVLEAARWAPSWANTQCWRFIVVRNRNIKTRLAGTMRATNRGVAAIESAPLAIVFCAEMGKAGYLKDNPEPATDKGDWFMFDVALAMHNLVLAAHSLGLATVYIGSFDAKKAAGILELPEGLCVVAMTPLGFPDQERGPGPRKELSEIASFDKYGDNKFR